jgi:flavorubredoxin
LVQSAAYLASALRPKVKFLSVIGSYGWGGRTLEILQGVLAPLRNAEILPPVIIKGAPRTADFNALDELARNIAQKHREISTVS